MNGHWHSHLHKVLNDYNIKDIELNINNTKKHLLAPGTDTAVVQDTVVVHSMVAVAAVVAVMDSMAVVAHNRMYPTSKRLS